MKRIFALLMAGTVMMSCAPVTAFAVSDESFTDTASTSVTETSADESEAMTEAEVQEQINVTESEDGTVTFSFGDWEWSTDSESTSTKIGTVTDVSSYLHLRNGAGMNYDIIGHLLPGAQVEVVGEDGDWYEVIVPEQTGYVHSDYLTVLESADSSDDVDEQMLATLLYIMMLSTNSESGASLTPDGNLTLVDDIGSSTGAGQQFLTFVTKLGNTFYMIIDRNDDGEENVHFLNLVDEADLLALMDEETAAQYQTTPVEETVQPAETEMEEPAVTETVEEEKTEKKSMALPLILLFLVGIGGVGGFLYFKTNDKKKPKSDAPDPDADYQDEDDAYDIPDDEEESDSDEYDEDVDELETEE